MHMIDDCSSVDKKLHLNSIALPTFLSLGAQRIQKASRANPSSLESPQVCFSVISKKHLSTPAVLRLAPCVCSKIKVNCQCARVF